MKKVAFVVIGINSGGIENYLLRFLKYSKSEIEPIVICTKKAEGALIEEFKALNIQIITKKVSYFNLIYFSRLYRFLNSYKFNAICDFSGDFSAFTLLISRMAGIDNRMAFYRNSKFQFKMSSAKWLYVKILKSVLRLSKSKILANSEYALDVFHPEWRKNEKTVYRIIHNGVPYKTLPSNSNGQLLKHSLNIPNNCKVIGHVGNFRKAKNHDTIINIAKSIVSKNKFVRFLLVGNEVKEGITNTLKRNNIESYFIMPGIRKDIPELLNIMDVFLFPSTDEGQPNALIEAMLYEVPVFASNIPTIEECTPKEIKKYLFPPNDHQSISNAILDYLVTEKIYNVKKVSAWAKIEFNPEARFEEFLNELI